MFVSTYNTVTVVTHNLRTSSSHSFYPEDGGNMFHQLFIISNIVTALKATATCCKNLKMYSRIQ
jgi:hypothetical protein